MSKGIFLTLHFLNFETTPYRFSCIRLVTLGLNIFTLDGLIKSLTAGIYFSGEV